jgi:hypothetical protein
VTRCTCSFGPFSIEAQMTDIILLELFSKRAQFFKAHYGRWDTPGPSLAHAYGTCKSPNQNFHRQDSELGSLLRERSGRRKKHCTRERETEMMAANGSTGLSREQKIVSALCKHLSLDPVSHTSLFPFPFPFSLIFCFTL